MWLMGQGRECEHRCHGLLVKAESQGKKSSLSSKYNKCIQYVLIRKLNQHIVCINGLHLGVISCFSQACLE